MSARGQAVGLVGEDAAEKYLTWQGMRCLARRYRGGDGEIDLVMEDGGTVVFVEVKARPAGRPGDGLAAVTAGKKRRIAHAAGAFLLDREWFSRPVRFDVVEITAQGLYHVPNAFQPTSWV